MRDPHSSPTSHYTILRCESKTNTTNTVFTNIRFKTGLEMTVNF